MAKMAKWFKNHISIFLIVILGFSLRLIYLREWFHFEMDEEVISWKLRPFLQEGRPFLIGGGTPFGFHLGPAFYYLSSIPLFFSGLDPIGWGAAAAIFGTLTIFLMWLVGKNLYGRRVGLIAALMWVTSFTTVMTDRHWWPLVLDPILALLVILCLYKISVIPARARFDSARRAGIYINRFRVLPSLTVRLQELFVHGSRSAIRRAGKHGMTWIGLGLTLAFAWQADLTVLPLFLAAGATAILNFRRHRRGILIAGGILLVSVLPLVVFELRHPGANLGKGLEGLNYLRFNLNKVEPFEAVVFIPTALSRLLFPITHLDGNLLNFYTWCREIVYARVAGQPWWGAAIVAMVLLTPFLSEKFAKLLTGREVSQTSHSAADKVMRLVIISSIAGILIFRFLGGNLYDFYLAVLYPVVLILAARAVDFIWRKRGMITAVSVLAVIAGLNLTAIYRANHPQGLAVKQEAAAWAAGQLNGNDFELDSLSKCSRYNGVRYLFFLENMEPAKSFVDQDLSWLYRTYDEEAKPEYLVTFVTYNDLTESDRERYDQLQTLSVAVKRFGDLEVLIQESPGRTARRLLINRR